MRIDLASTSHDEFRMALDLILTDAGNLALQHFHARNSLVVEEKSHVDFVSNADRAVEECIRNGLAAHFPEDAVIGEEFGGASTRSYWIVDPIDGTSNFLSGLPLWCISIAYVRDGIPEFGAISAPALDLTTIGGPGSGLTISDPRYAQFSDLNPLCGIGRNSTWPSAARHSVELAIETQGQSVVSLGSCALSLMYVALGHLSGYREDFCGGFWDCAGGIALCESANKPVNYSFNEDNTVNVAAGKLAKN